MAVLATVLGLLLMFAPVPQDVVSSQFRDMGHIDYDSALVERPDIGRLYGLTEFVMDYIEARCVPECVLEPSMLNIHIKIVPYAEFEDMLLYELDARESTMADKIRGDGGLIDGHTLTTSARSVIYFFQNPPDVLYIHELLHVIYPFDEEVVTYARQMEIISSRAFKDWLRNNY
jgi:hypothetical protein